MIKTIPMLALALLTSATLADGRVDSALVLLDAGGMKDVHRAVLLVEEAGGVVRHVFPNTCLIADGVDVELERSPVIESVLVDRDVEVSWILGSHGTTAHYAALAWQDLGRLEPSPKALVAPKHFDDVVLERERPAYCDAPGSGTSTGARFCDTSEYLVGTVTISLMFPESNGAIDPSTEDWTPERLTELIGMAVASCDWWVSKAAEHGVTLSFSYSFYTDLPTSYEPISRPYSDRWLWISECLDGLGVPSGESDYHQAVTFADAERGSSGTDWAATAWIVNCLNDEDGHFADGVFAMAYLGGPYLVVPTGGGAGGTGDDWFDNDFAHEFGHLFYALDQYWWSNCACASESGYLDATNENCDHSCAHDDTLSVMRYPYQVPSLVDWTVDLYAAGQLGWWDGDTNGVPDILDTHPLITLPTRPPNTTVAGPHEYAGSTVVNPLPNLNPHGEQNDISVNEIVDVKWRVDDGLWASAVATDGAFDSGEEGFSFATDTLAVGTHVIEVVAMNDVGNYSEEAITDTVTVVDWVGVPESTVGRQIVLHASSPNPFSDLSVIRYTLPRAGEVTLEVHNMAGRRVRQLVRGELQCAGGHVVSWNGRDDRGRPVASGVYFCRLVMGSDSVARKMIQLQ